MDLLSSWSIFLEKYFFINIFLIFIDDLPVLCYDGWFVKRYEDNEKNLFMCIIKELYMVFFYLN